MLAGPGGMVQITELPVPKTETEPLEAVLGLYDLVADPAVDDGEP